MKKLGIYKKYYTGLSYDKIFNAVLSIVLVLEINLVSHTLNISKTRLVLIGVFLISLLLIGVLSKTKNITREIENNRRKIISQNSIDSLKIVRVYGWLPIIPLILLIFLDKDNLILCCILISIILLLIVKYFFDNIITFRERGYDKFVESDYWYMISCLDNTKTHDK